MRTFTLVKGALRVLLPVPRIVLGIPACIPRRTSHSVPGDDMGHPWCASAFRTLFLALPYSAIVFVGTS